MPPLSDRDREQLESLLDALPAPLEPPDVSALDGFLVGVVLQPEAVPQARWLPFAHDFDAGRRAPASVDLAPLQALVLRRHAELAAAVSARKWFDPWVFDLEPAAIGEPVSPSDIVLPWIAGFAAALERFPSLLLSSAGPEAREPLATLFSHFDAADLEDVGDLAKWIEQVEPAETAEQAVEDLVRCTLLLADTIHPQPHARVRARRAPKLR
jgi:uncharacterized protein